MAINNNKPIEKALTDAKDNWEIGLLLLKHKDHGGFDALAAAEKDVASLAAMNGGAGAAASEWDSGDYSRQLATYANGGSGVVMDAGNDNGKLVPDDYEYPALSASVADPAHKVGYAVWYTNHTTGPADSDREVIAIIEWQSPQLPTGAPFAVNPPDEGIWKIQN
ncbi:MAG: hypothetical protein ACYTGL_14755 [Planctomycetota bacterium]|jgi:hypothetical protein